MKTVKVEVEVLMPDEMDEVSVSDGIDHMLDSGGAAMVNEVFLCGATHVIDPEIAKDCVELTVADSTVVSSLENQPEKRDPQP